MRPDFGFHQSALLLGLLSTGSQCKKACPILGRGSLCKLRISKGPAQRVEILRVRCVVTEAAPMSSASKLRYINQKARNKARCGHQKASQESQASCRNLTSCSSPGQCVHVISTLNLPCTGPKPTLDLPCTRHAPGDPNHGGKEVASVPLDRLKGPAPIWNRASSPFQRHSMPRSLSCRRPWIANYDQHRAMVTYTSASQQFLSRTMACMGL